MAEGYDIHMIKNIQVRLLLLILPVLLLSAGGFIHAETGNVEKQIPVGIWMDITTIPRDTDKMYKIIDDLKDSGITHIYAQVFNRGLTIYPSEVAEEYGLPAQRDIFKDLDPLRCLIDYAHSKGVKVHAWMDVLYVGYKEPGTLLRLYPSWEMISGDGSKGCGPQEARQYWLSPASPGAKTYLAKLLGELVSGYDIDGVHLDYIRYPDPLVGDCGYEPDCIGGFTEKYGINPMNIDIRQADQGDPKSMEELALWNTWRASKVTELVSILAQVVAEKKAGVLVSAAVAPIGAPYGSFPGLLQDWPYWIKSGMLDYVIPMTYTSRPEELRGLTRWTALLLDQRYPPICGVQIWKRKTCDDIIRQLTILDEENAAGAVLFAQSYFNSDAALAVKSFLTGQTHVDNCHIPTFISGEIPDKPLKFAEIPFTSSPPCVDGDLSDEVWLGVDDFQVLFDVMKPGREWPGDNPWFKIVYDEKGIYMAFSISLPDSVSEQRITARDGAVFYEDSVEIFFDPFSCGSLFYHFAFNRLGARYDATRLLGPSWDCDWDVKCQEKGGVWQSEIFIPFDGFWQGFHDLKEWGFNVCMNSPNSNKFISWAYLPGIYAAPHYFGKIKFKAKSSENKPNPLN
jgi:uncharacterized lipoprotein YddW (UPF0748 family)